MIELSPDYVLRLFRGGRDTFDIAHAFGITEPQVLRLLETARFQERSARRAG